MTGRNAITTARSDANIPISTISTATVDSAEIWVRSPLIRRSASTAIGATPACRSVRPPPAAWFARGKLAPDLGEQRRLRGAVQRRVAGAEEDDRVAPVRRHELVAVHLQRAGPGPLEAPQDCREPLQRIRRRQPREHRRQRQPHLLLQRPRRASERGVGQSPPAPPSPDGRRRSRGGATHTACRPLRPWRASARVRATPPRGGRPARPPAPPRRHAPPSGRARRRRGSACASATNPRAGATDPPAGGRCRRAGSG